MNYIGLKEVNVTETVKTLNDLLASYHVYYQNLRNFHWNIKGENFYELHEKFEELYHDAREKIDDIAERILTLSSYPISRLSDYLAVSKVKEAIIMENDMDMAKTVLENHKILIGQMRQVIARAEKVGDHGTIEMMGQFLIDLEKKSWMLDSWLTRTYKPQPN